MKSTYILEKSFTAVLKSDEPLCQTIWLIVISPVLAPFKFVSDQKVYLAVIGSKLDSTVFPLANFVNLFLT